MSILDTSTFEDLEKIGSVADQHKVGIAIADKIMSARSPGMDEHEWALLSQAYVRGIINAINARNTVHILQFCALELGEYID